MYTFDSLNGKVSWSCCAEWKQQLAGFLMNWHKFASHRALGMRSVAVNIHSSGGQYPFLRLGMCQCSWPMRTVVSYWSYNKVVYPWGTIVVYSWWTIVVYPWWTIVVYPCRTYICYIHVHVCWSHYYLYIRRGLYFREGLYLYIRVVIWLFTRGRLYFIYMYVDSNACLSW